MDTVIAENATTALENLLAMDSPANPAVKIAWHAIGRFAPFARSPRKMTRRAAAFDVYLSAPLRIPAGHSGVVIAQTSVALNMPEGYFGLLIQRSSTLFKRGIEVILGIIDGDFGYNT